MFGKTSVSEPLETRPNVSPRPEQTDAKTVSQNSRVQHSIFSADTSLSGDLASDGDLTIEGKVDGSISCRALTLSGQPTITGSVEAETVYICGSFTGDIRASKVILSKSARMVGDIFQETLEVHPEAHYEGRVGRLHAQRVRAH